MAKKSNKTLPLFAAFDAALAPVYLIDTPGLVTYANSALATWVEAPLEQITGRRVAYHADDLSEATGLLAGLCPSPTSLTGQRGRGVVSCSGRQGGLRHRRAEFLPLAQEAPTGQQSSCPVLVLCDSSDLTQQEIRRELAAEPSSDQLHLALQRFHRTESTHDCPLLLGDSHHAQRLRRQVEAIASSRSNALLVGPPGSGRSELARAVLNRISINSRPLLVPVDAARLPAELVLDRVSSAINQPDGQSQLVLVENLDQLSPEAQSSLAAQLKNGGQGWLLATAETSQLTEGLVATVATLTVLNVPLADRKQDLPLLAQAAVERQNLAAEKQLGGFEPLALEKLVLYSWPGGLRELDAVVSQAHADASGPLIHEDDLPTVVRQAALVAELPARTVQPVALDAFLGKVERELIERALQHASGNKAEAARLLGMTRPRLYRRLASLGLLSEQPEQESEGRLEADRREGEGL